jgi:hypothetical protein
MLGRRVTQARADETDLVADEGELDGAATLVLLAAAQAFPQSVEVVCELLASAVRGHRIFSRFFQPAHFEPASRLFRVNRWPTLFVRSSWATRSLLSMRASFVASMCCSSLLPVGAGGSGEPPRTSPPGVPH